MTTGTLFDIKRFSVQDGPGIRTTVFLKGCPLNCAWCHNPESQDANASPLYRPSLCIQCDGCLHTDPARAAEVCPSEARTMVGRMVTAESVINEISRDSAFFDESNGGVTFSGGEPLAQPGFLAELLDRSGELGLHRAVDTCGYAGAETLARIATRTDLFLVDVKLMDSSESLRWTGVPSEPIQRNIRWLSKSGKPMEIRMPIIPGITDTPANLSAAQDFLMSLPGRHTVRLLPHHRSAMSKYEQFGIGRRMPDTADPSSEQIETLADQMRSAGLTIKTAASITSKETAS